MPMRCLRHDDLERNYLIHGYTFDNHKFGSFGIKCNGKVSLFEFIKHYEKMTKYENELYNLYRFAKINW